MKMIYPGSFDPLTFGHYDIIERASSMCEFLYVAIATNSSKASLFTVEERVELVKEATANIKNVQVEAFEGLLANYVMEKNIKYVVRGLRAVSDFEYEFQLALMNRKINHDFETIFLMPSQKYIFLSSTIVKDIARHGGDTSEFVPKNVSEALCQKYKRC